MAITAAPRSVSDATRFTPTTPHAASKPSTSASSPASRFTPSSGSSAAGSRPPPAGGSSTLAETPDQRVARLRAAHLAAKNSNVSQFDRLVTVARGFFDSAHKLTVVGLIGFTAIAGLLTAYTAADMMMYNRKRKVEFLEAQRKMEADSLAAARLAYMTNKATEDQIRLVEEANARAAAGESGFKMPSVLGAPSAITSTSSDSAPADASSGAAATLDGSTVAIPAAAPQEKKAGFRSWFFSSLTRSEEGDTPGTSQRRLGYESLCEEDDGSGVRDSDLVRAIDDRQAYLREKARAALEREKELERKGGALDRLGLDEEGAGKGDTKGDKRRRWWW